MSFPQFSAVHPESLPPYGEGFSELYYPFRQEGVHGPACTLHDARQRAGTLQSEYYSSIVLDGYQTIGEHGSFMYPRDIYGDSLQVSLAPPTSVQNAQRLAGNTGVHFRGSGTQAVNAEENTVCCLWKGCGQRVQGTVAAVNEHFKSVHLRRPHGTAFHTWLRTRSCCKWHGCSCGKPLFHQNLVKHVTSTHLRLTSAVCDRCGTVLRRKDELKRHAASGVCLLKSKGGVF